MKFVPIFNDSAALHLTQADWDSLISFHTHVAVDALNLLINDRSPLLLVIPKNIRNLFFYTRVRACHKISGFNKTTKAFSLYSPHDGRKIAVTSETLQALAQQMQTIFPEKKIIWVDEENNPMDYWISEQPAQDAEKGVLYRRNSSEKMDIQDKRWADVSEPIDLECSCYTCQNFTLAYLHHLKNTGVLLGTRLAIIHNLSATLAD